jgi:hypothetical protein
MRNSFPTRANPRGKNANILFAFGQVLAHLPRPLLPPGGSRFTYGDNDRINS